MSLFELEKRKDSNHPFLVSQEGVETFGEFFSDAFQLGSSLERGVGLIVLENSRQALLAYCSLLSANAVPLFLDYKSSRESVERVVGTFRPRYVFSDVDLSLGGYAVLTEFRGMFLSRSAGKDVDPLHPDLALLQLTSGSTGSPRAVRLSRAGVKAVTESIGRYMQLDSSRRFYAHLPFSYVYGLSIVNLALSHGASVFLAKDPFFAPRFWDLGARHGVTDFSGVPFHYESLARGGFERFDLSSLKCATQAGGKLSPELVEFFFRSFEERGIDFFVMYGQAEAGPRISFLGPRHPGERTESVGRPIDIGTLSIDSVGNQQPGEVVYRGVNVAMGYAESWRDLAAEDSFRGVLKTGDIGTLDSEGYLYIRGRLKRVVKINGLSVSLDEVEHRLQREFGFVAVVGNDGSLLVVSESEAPPDVSEISRLFPAIHPSAFSVVSVESLPVKASGKLDYQALERDLF